MRDEVLQVYQGATEVMETKEEIKTVKAIVEYLLLTDERNRNDDKWLTWNVMRHFTPIYIPFEDFEKIPSFESITRIRAHIQNKLGMFPPTSPDVIKKRKCKKREMEAFLKENVL